MKTIEGSERERYPLGIIQEAIASRIPREFSAWQQWPGTRVLADAVIEALKVRDTVLRARAQPPVADGQTDLAFSVYSGLNALRWLLNITTEFDRKDVRTRQAAHLLDEYVDSFGKTNRDRLEDMWKTLYDKLPDDGRIREYLRAHDAAGRALKAKGAIND